MACPTVGKNAEGFIGHVSIELVDEQCQPARPLGDGGVQFVGTFDDGTTVVTSSLARFWGGYDDGGLNGIRTDSTTNRQSFSIGANKDNTGPCASGGLEWFREDAGVYVLTQSWTTVAGVCADHRPEIPRTTCVTARRFTFTEEKPCNTANLITVGDEVDCND